MDQYIFAGILIFPFLIFVILLFYFQRKYHREVQQFTKIPIRRIEKKLWIPRVPGGRWLLLNKKQKSYYFSEEGVRIYDKYIALIYLLFSLFIIFFCVYLYVLIFR